MSDVITQTLVANQEAVFSGGLFFRIVSSAAPVQVTGERDAIGDVKAAAAPAGFQIGPLPETRRVFRWRILSTINQDIVLIIGDDVADVVGVTVSLGNEAKQGANQYLAGGITVGTTNNTLQPSGPIRSYRGTLLKAPASNSGTINLVDPVTDQAGLGLEAGDTQFLPVGNASPTQAVQLVFRATAAGQTLEYAHFYDNE